MAKHAIIGMSAPVTITAAEADKPDGPKAFSSTFYTGGPLSIAGWDHPVVVDLAGLKPGNVLVANLDHDASKRVGNFEAVNDGKTLIANGKANAATAARDEVVNSAIEGYQWQASLEVNPTKVEMLAKGKTATVNGQEVTGPAYIARTGTLKGFGFVSHGADDNTTATIAASAASSQKDRKMEPKFKAWVEAMGFDADSLSDDQVAGLQANYNGQNAKKKTPDIAAGFEGVKAEASRVDAITAYALDKCEQQPRNVDSIKILAEQAIEEKWPLDKFRLEVLEATAPKTAPPWNRQKTDDRISAKTLEAALCVAGGLKDVENHFTDQQLQSAHDRFKEGIGLNELLKIVASSYGYRTDSNRANIEMQNAAFGRIQGSGFSTLSLPGIISNTANKFLLEGWGGGEMAWMNVTDIRSVRNFQTTSQYRLGGTMKYDKVGPDGELKHGVVGETEYSVKANTYGKMFAITRENIINDDLSALSAVPRELGYGANEAFNEVFWTTWLAGVGSGFFAYTSTGALTSAAALASIASAEAAFFALTKPNGEPLGVNPNVMLVPNGSYRVAQSAMASPIVTGGSSTVPAANTFQGEYKVVRSAYLSNTAYTGYSTIVWYLCSVRPGFAPIQTAFLNGQQAPMIESADAEFNTLGIQMRGVHDFGCNLFEARSVVKGSGA